MKVIQNLNIEKLVPLISPQELKAELPALEINKKTIIESRQIIENIITKKDLRLLVIVGPCSIHDPKAALEYAQKINKLRIKYQDKLYIVMRVYFEKPRTVIGWKGLINDPNLDDSCDMTKGLRIGRKLLLDITLLGLPIASEMLDPISPQYISDLISWAALGARTTESQTHREMASGLSMPVGYKNGTDGGLDVAISAIQSTLHPHSFIGIDENGKTAIVRTKGNPVGHIILRGGRQGQNYDSKNIIKAIKALNKANLPQVVMIDCSHGNSDKKPENQAIVLENIKNQINNGNKTIIGFMLESFLKDGSQKLTLDLSKLEYGKSITDACIGWKLTEKLLENFYQELVI